MTTLNRNLRENLHVFWNNDRGALFVLLNLQLRANNRNRCFPTIATIAKDTGMSERAVKRSLKFLEDIGAITKIEVEKRIGKEAKIKDNQNVYEVQSQAQHEDTVIKLIYAGKDDDYEDTPVTIISENGDTADTKSDEKMVTPESPKVINIESSNENDSSNPPPPPNQDDDDELSFEKIPTKPVETIPVEIEITEVIDAPAGSDKPTPEDDAYLLLQTPLERLDSLRNQSRSVQEPDQRTNVKGYTTTPFYKHIERIFSFGAACNGTRFKGKLLGDRCRWFHNEATGRDGQPATLNDLLDMLAWYIRETTDADHPDGYSVPRNEKFATWWQQWKDKHPTVASIVQDFDNARANAGTSIIESYLADYDAALAKAKKKGVA